MPSAPPVDDQPDASPPAEAFSVRIAVRRVIEWARANRLKSGLLALLCLAAVSTAGGLWWVLSYGTASAKAVLAEALAALDAGQWSEARRMAERLRDQADAAPETVAGSAFVMGAALAFEADQNWEPQRKNLYVAASRYLKESRDRGFPSGRKPQGLLLLGRSLYASDHFAASRPVLREALEVNPDKRPEIHALLAETYLNEANPQYEQALKENTLYLAAPNLAPEDRQRGMLKRARILLHLNRTAECAQILSEIPRDAKDRAEAIVLEGQLLLHETRQLAPGADASPPAAEEAETRRREKIASALEVLRRAEDRDTLSTQAGGKAMYLIGIGLLELKDYRAALDQFARVHKFHPDTPEAFAALFQQAEVMRLLGRAKDALPGYLQVLTEAGGSRAYRNPWISLDELRRRILLACRESLAGEDFEFCDQLVAHLHPLFSLKEQTELAARTHRDWGHSLVGKSQGLPPSKAKPLESAGREQLRRAGLEFERLAKLRIAEREYPDDLWEAAEAYLAGHDFRRSARLFQQYLQNETRRRRARALVGLGEAMLAMGRTKEAMAACRECIDFHRRDAAAFSARLVLAGAHVEKGEAEQAKQLLEENLGGELLTPASKEWRESLFQLGRLLHRQGNYEEAIQRLKEAIQRYPDSPRRIEAEYLIADSYRLTAQELERRSQQDQAGATRLARFKRSQELFGASLAAYREVQETLARRQETDELTELETLTLRNCYFSIGRVLFALRQYEDAIVAYGMVTNRYQNSPEVLDAYLQIARAYQQLGKPMQARGTLQQAKIVLARMKPETPFELTTNYSRDQWAALLDQLTAS